MADLTGELPLNGFDSSHPTCCCCGQAVAVFGATSLQSMASLGRAAPLVASVGKPQQVAASAELVELHSVAAAAVAAAATC